MTARMMVIAVAVATVNSHEGNCCMMVIAVALKTTATAVK